MLGTIVEGRYKYQLLLGAPTPCKDLWGRVTLPSHVRTSEEIDNTPLPQGGRDGASPLAAWIVVSQHQEPLSMGHNL